MRLPLRALSILFIAAGVATCSDTPPTAVKHSAPGPNGGAVGRVAFEPVFTAAALQVAQDLPDFGIHYDRVRIVLVRPVSDTAKDTTIAFGPGHDDLVVKLTVEVHSSADEFQIGIDYLSSDVVVFHGGGQVHAHPPDQPAPPQEQVAVEYVGPGANVARIVVSPKTITLPSDKTATFVASAFDAANNPVATVPLSWSTSDPAVATISGAGSLQPQGRRGSVVVTAITPTGISDRATAAVLPPPAAVVLVSGGGQTGTVGAPVAVPVVVQVNAADGLSVPGASVAFSPPAGGHVADTIVTADANGRASTNLTFGSAAGQQLFTASVGNVQTQISEVASPGAPASIAIVSGSGQTDTVRKSLEPLVARVTDRFGNPTPGVAVTWTRTSGSGSLATTTSTTDADGRATASYTLGTIAGPESVSASVAGVATRAIFVAQAIAGAPALIAIVSGDAQTGTVNTLLGAPLAVKVADAGGNAVSGATVRWAATNGAVSSTSITNAAGRTSVNLKLGSRSGPASASAAIVNGKRVAFTATALPGSPAAIVFSTQPTNGAAGAVLSTVRATLLDAGGNQTTAADPVAVALGNNPTGAALGGTLVRNAVNGVATFDDLVVDKAGSGYTLVASTNNVHSATSSPFNVSVFDASSLIVVAGDNQRAAAGSPVAIAPSVKVTDASGNPVAGVSVTFSPSDGGAVLPSTATTTNASGVATLTSWNLGPHAGPQTLVASSPGLASVSISANAFGGPPAMLAIVTQPSTTAQSGVPLDVQPVIQVEDHFGNPVATGSLIINVTVSAGSLVGTTSMTADPLTGLATFTDLGIAGAGTVMLTFSAQGVQSATSTSIIVSSGLLSP